MSYNGFSEANIVTQCQKHYPLGLVGLTKSSFVVLKHEDDTESDTRVKIGGFFEAHVFQDEVAWMIYFRKHVHSKLVRIPKVYGLFKNDQHDYYLVYEYIKTGMTIREIMNETKAPLDAPRAERIIQALIVLHETVKDIDLSAGLTPIENCNSEDFEGWVPRGYMFGDLSSNRHVRSIQEKLDYIARIFRYKKLAVPAFGTICANHGDPSSDNFLEDENGVIIPIDYGMTSFGPWWEDAYALGICDKPDYTAPLQKAAEKYGLVLDQALSDGLDQFYGFHTTCGFSFDRLDQQGKIPGV